MSAFPCTKCGACCKQAGYLRDFPEPLMPGTLRCVHLGDDNSCLIYSRRPEVCRIKGDFRENALGCNVLQVLTNTPAKYRLPMLDNA